jgi:hypothetical protein
MAGGKWTHAITLVCRTQDDATSAASVDEWLANAATEGRGTLLETGRRQRNPGQ